jgi:hypothetical protein
VLRFRITDPNSALPRDNLDDVKVMTMLAPAIWHQRQLARGTGDGVYEIEFSPPKPGVYYVYLECLSLGLSYNKSPFLIMRAEPAPVETAESQAVIRSAEAKR